MNVPSLWRHSGHWSLKTDDSRVNKRQMSQPSRGAECGTPQLGHQTNQGRGVTMGPCFKCSLPESVSESIGLQMRYRSLLGTVTPPGDVGAVSLRNTLESTGLNLQQGKGLPH